MPGVESKLAEVRKKRGVAAADLATRVGVTRQTIYAIEAGTYVPNTEVALRMARELDATVEELFALPAAAQPTTFATEVLSARTPAAGQPVRLCRVGDKWISVPVASSPYFLPDADGVLDHGNVAALAAAENRVVLAGCDPAASLLGDLVLTAPASSKLALKWLKEDKVHIAGTHLEDPKTGEFNLPYIAREFPAGDIAVVTFARWEEGFVTAAGNPKQIRTVDDLAARNVRFINRESGSGSRALLDKLLKRAAMDAANVHGYDRTAPGHLAAAYAVLSGDADACIATRSAAAAFGLDFVALRAERYDFAMRKRTLELPAVQQLMDVLQRAALRRKLEVLARYDTADTGRMVA